MSLLEPHWGNNEIAAGWEAVEKPLFIKAAQQHVPLGGIFELTAQCNLRCKMCFVRLDKGQVDKIGRELTTREWVDLAKEALRLGTLNLLLTGGEPLLRPDFTELYTELCHMGFIISLNTNAALMTPALRDLFCKYPPTAVNVTLYGATPDTYEKVCGNAGAFERTINGLELLAQTPVSLEVRSTFIKDNKDELEALRAIAHRYTKRFLINTHVTLPVRGAASAAVECRLTPDESMDLDIQNMQYFARLYAAENRLEAEKEAEQKRREKAERDEKWSTFRIPPPEVLTCFASKCLYALTWDGKMIPCVQFSHPYTLPLQEGFEAAWNRLPTLYMDIKPPQKCGDCEFNGACPNCPGNLQAETGYLDQAAPYMCAYGKARNERRANMQKEKFATSSLFNPD